MEKERVNEDDSETVIKKGTFQTERISSGFNIPSEFSLLKLSL